MEETKSTGTQVTIAPPSAAVPVGSANPTVQGGGSGASDIGTKKTSLPKKMVTLETLQEVGSPEAVRPSNDLAVKKSDAVETSKGASVPESETINAATKQTSDATDEDIELPDLTSEQLAFLTSERYRESSNMIKREFGMEDEDISFLAEMEHAVLGGVIDLEQLIVALRGEFPHLNETEKNRLIGILLAYRFEPFADQLKPMPTEAAKAQGIKLVPAPYYRVYTKPLTFRGAAHEVARMAGIDLMGQAQERLRDSIVSRMKGIRTDGQLEELFMRPPEQAGLGLSEEKARLAREAMVELIGRARLLSEDEYAKWLNDQIKQKKKESNPSVVVPSVPGALQTDEEKEIEEITRRMPQPSVLEETVLTRAVDMVAKGLSWKPTDSYLMNRLKNTISTRLRDVRSRNEVFIKLIRDDKVGGLGLERKQAEQVAEEIEKGYQQYRGSVAEDEKQKVKQQMVEQEQKVEERKRRDSEEHAKWYQEKIKAKQRSVNSGLELLKVIARGETTPIHPLDAKEEAKERALFGRLVEASKTGAVSDTTQAMRTLATAFKEGNAGSQKKTTSAPVVPAPDARPKTAPPTVKVSVETARMAERTKASAKTKIQDITPANRANGTTLSGPMQEIGQMTLERFRRLSSDPKGAMKRILDLVEVLGHESYERKIAAAEAWRSCPLQKQYLELVAAAFLGKKSVTDVAAEKRAKGEMSLTPEEISAIIDLNRALSL
jgi:hypothetical protein